MGDRIPQQVQNLVIRNYADRNRLTYLLSATEYAMPNCYMMLEKVIKELSGLEGVICYSLFMLPIVVIPYAIGFTGKLFLAVSLILTVYYNYICYDLLKFKKNKFELKKAQKVFAYSIFYLFLLFVLFLVDQVIK